MLPPDGYHNRQSPKAVTTPDSKTFASERDIEFRSLSSTYCLWGARSSSRVSPYGTVEDKATVNLVY
ncbi:hypothetical protein J2S89_001728 [Arthrobacter bambusae]|nr:hypothetical protein [Arthrobacter bambusae]MDQ0097576.1 hypothetical protein [Arthrobacter bambusae]